MLGVGRCMACIGPEDHLAPDQSASVSFFSPVGRDQFVLFSQGLPATQNIKISGFFHSATPNQVSGNLRSLFEISNYRFSAIRGAIRFYGNSSAEARTEPRKRDALDRQ